jgi:murein DD-endopeptidase MepM/ murein hydrolase activator NlpD
MRAFDGQTWTYCHLSYVEPSIVDGAQLKAGAPVGLVGHTGDATGPHLHLQLQPALDWPQREAWFQQFAGVAFSWQDPAPADWPAAATRTLEVFGGASATPQAEAPVFQVVPEAPAPSDGGVVLFTPAG